MQVEYPLGQYFINFNVEALTS